MGLHAVWISFGPANASVCETSANSGSPHVHFGDDASCANIRMIAGPHGALGVPLVSSLAA